MLGVDLFRFSSPIIFIYLSTGVKSLSDRVLLIFCLKLVDILWESAISLKIYMIKSSIWSGSTKVSSSFIFQKLSISLVYECNYYFCYSFYYFYLAGSTTDLFLIFISSFIFHMYNWVLHEFLSICMFWGSFSSNY